MTFLGEILPLLVAAIGGAVAFLELFRFRQRQERLDRKLSDLTRLRQVEPGDSPLRQLPPADQAPAALLPAYQRVLAEYRHDLERQIHHEEERQRGESSDAEGRFPNADRIGAFLRALREERRHEQHTGTR